MAIEGIMVQHNLDDTLALLARTPAALDALLRGLPSIWIDRPEGEKTWTVFGVIAHLVDAERVNWMPRARHILDFGAAAPVPSFDREGGQRQAKGKSLGLLLDEFARLRSENLAALRALNLEPSQLERAGCHPALGAVTLSQLLAAWVTHDLTHLHQISRIMAHQYREAVGAWSRFLGVLHCDGHSLPA
jgi:DinB superfamily